MDDWQISDGARRVVREGFDRYLATVGRPSFEPCAAIMWSLGGDGVLADGERVIMPPRYDLCLIDRGNIAAQGFFTIDDAMLGVIAFMPSAADRAGGRRQIDYDGKDIVVR